jgi:hypothetical protein
MTALSAKNASELGRDESFDAHIVDCALESAGCPILIDGDSKSVAAQFDSKLPTSGQPTT